LYARGALKKEGERASQPLGLFIDASKGTVIVTEGGVCHVIAACPTEEKITSK
jgi:hypothetical protein